MYELFCSVYLNYHLLLVWLSVHIWFGPKLLEKNISHYIYAYVCVYVCICDASLTTYATRCLHRTKSLVYIKQQ